jgi:hypothetical protein
MNTKILAVSAAALLVTAGTAQAAAGGRYAEPKQPIAYSQMNAYLKASPKQRATRDFSGGMAANTQTATPVMGASTGSAADTAATVPASPTTAMPQTSAAPAPQMSTAPADAMPNTSTDTNATSAGAPSDTTATPSTANTADKPAAPMSPSTAVNPPAQP